MDSNKVRKMVELYFTFNNIEGEDSLHVEENKYNDVYFRWNKQSFKHGKKYTVIYNDLSVLLFDTATVRDRLASNLDKIKNNPDNTLFAVNYGIVKDVIRTLNIEPFTEEDKKEIEEQQRYFEESKKRKKERWERTHCTCEVPDVRVRINGLNNSIEFCLECNKMI